MFPPNDLNTMALMEILLLFVLGCVGGFLFGMVGIGGNVLYIPIFSFLLTQLGFQNEELSRAVIANALVILVFTGTAVSWKQFKVGNFFLREILLTASTGVTAAFFLSLWIKSGNWYDKKLFDLVFTSLLVFTLLRLFTSKTKENAIENQENDTPSVNLETGRSESSKFPKSRVPFLLVGIVTGSLTALSGLGGSIIMIPLFTEFVGLSMKKAHSIAVGVVPLVALTISVFYFFGKPSIMPLPHYQWGYLNLGIAAPVIVGSMCTSPYGVQAAHKVKPKIQRLVFVGILSIVLLKMLFNLT
jgi:uncharacterized protein